MSTLMFLIEYTVFEFTETEHEKLTTLLLCSIITVFPTFPAFGLALTASNPLLGGLITAGSGFPGLGLVGALG